MPTTVTTRLRSNSRGLVGKRGEMDMRRTMLMLTAAALVAAPAAAMNTTAVPGAELAGNVVNTTVADPANATAPVNGMTAAPGAPVTAEPMAPPVTADTGATEERGDRGFPWGLVGLVGLVGLLGRRRRNDG